MEMKQKLCVIILQFKSTLIVVSEKLFYLVKMFNKLRQNSQINDEKLDVLIEHIYMLSDLARTNNRKTVRVIIFRM